MTMLVLSPSVAATKASASEMPAASRIDVSIPCPRWNSPVQSGPRRPRDSSFSSMTTTSQPSSPSRLATADPTLPTPTMRAFTGASLVARPGRASFVQDALRVRDHHDLAGSPPQDVVDRRAEEARLPPPARRGAEEDQVGSICLGLLDDGLSDRPPTHDLALDVDTMLGGEELRLGERGLRPLLLVGHLGGEREVERHTDDVQRADGAAALLGEADRGGQHLLADLAELDRHENPLVDPFLLGDEVGDRGLDGLHEPLPPRLAHRDEENRPEDEPDGPGDPRSAMRVERRDPEHEGERRADERRDG